MRIVSLVPHATELLYALGLGDEVVAVTHECDYPTEAQAKPQVTRDRLPPGLSAAEIDRAVRERTEAGDAIYELDEELLRELEPDLIVTQALCPVCAVSYDEVAEVARRIATCPKVIALDPKTLGETMGDIRTLAQATGRRDAGLDLVARQRSRIDRVKIAVRGADRPRVAAIEWFDPVFIGGHWTPQLIDLAGGIDVLGLPGEHSAQVMWEDVIAARPEVVVCMPCGYDAPRAHLESELYAHELRRLSARDVVAVDAAATFSRPGPRLVDGLELLAHVLHPDLVGPPAYPPIPVAL
ncbi:ABC transporter substrate-binding protein [Paraconexibacter antarcticus]|uniref:ABC transporter substrate-binding protein n=1 Tax=Paraconexibacter antarcticus TaxID=2949664 RepID=A0ABY5DWY6_9ACTN|nr:ABC transporter substrate-binding protein [Paraconexibacter antarcticus]UTI66543.1 ABC transporter substrate-binding protein [Paraconexibacter antarcticus]